jgi:hypothetical protein
MGLGRRVPTPPPPPSLLGAQPGKGGTEEALQTPRLLPARRRRPFQDSSGHAGSRLAAPPPSPGSPGGVAGGAGPGAEPGQERHCVSGRPAPLQSPPPRPSRPPSSSGLAGWPSCVPLAALAGPQPSGTAPLPPPRVAGSPGRRARTQPGELRAPGSWGSAAGRERSRTPRGPVEPRPCFPWLAALGRPGLLSERLSRYR